MGTFLGTSRMHPDLRARLERAVGARPGGLGRTARVVSRVALAAAIASVLWAVMGTVSRRRGDREAIRARLGGALQAHAAAPTQAALDLPARVASWVARAAAPPYPGDFAAPEVRAPGALDRALSRPLVYVRGPLLALAASPTSDASLEGSRVDGLLVCLLAPPTAKTESAVLRQLQRWWRGDAEIASRVSRAYGLGELAPALRRLGEPWAARVVEADDTEALGRLERDLAKVDMGAAARAASVELVVVAVDEPAERGPAELDGERPHAVRLALIDARDGHELARVRRRVDPSWLSESSRATSAMAADSCAFAVDARGSVGP